MGLLGHQGRMPCEKEKWNADDADFQDLKGFFYRRGKEGGAEGRREIFEGWER